MIAASGNPRRITIICLASPVGADPRIHKYEIEYECYDNGVVKMVPGTLKDLGPANEEEISKAKQTPRR